VILSVVPFPVRVPHISDRRAAQSTWFAISVQQLEGVANITQPSATGQNWEKFTKKFADDEVEEKKITPLTDE
jgi:hypothetical protein